MTTNAIAHELNEQGREHAAKGRYVDAQRAYRKSAAADPSWSVPWYNLGLMQKYRQEWRESLECNLRAVQIDQSDEAAWWNLGIAATALRDWFHARLAWRACGIDVPEADGPIELDLGLVPIRLNVDSDAEVVWARRIDPARAILENIPLPSSAHRWHDLVLHDGAANGYRKLNGRDVPVFDEIAVLEQAKYRTFIAELNAPQDALEALRAAAEQLGGFAEDWSTNTRLLCKQCSEGNPCEFHDGTAIAPANPYSGIAAYDQRHAEEILCVWQNGGPDRHALAIRAAELALGSDKGLSR